jgi:hypothetical protein
MITLHNIFIGLSPSVLAHIKKWASDECDGDRYNRKICKTREQREYWSGRLQVHLLLKSEADLVLAQKKEEEYAIKRRETMDSSE